MLMSLAGLKPPAQCNSINLSNAFLSFQYVFFYLSELLQCASLDAISKLILFCTFAKYIKLCRLVSKAITCI